MRLSDHTILLTIFRFGNFFELDETDEIIYVWT
jgi:hypothetical protein